MAIVVNTNVSSLNAQRNLVGTGKLLQRSLQRLSSGLRINSAKDDAAGLAISDRMNAQIRGLNQAVRNANDGISLAQTAEGAMQEMTSGLQRIRELAVQSLNNTNTASDRASLNAEVQQLISEFDRIAYQTSFNNKNLLDGTFSGTFQIGFQVNQTISLDISDMRASSVGSTSTYTTVNNEMSNNMADFAQRIYTAYHGAFSSSTINGQGVDNVSADTNTISKINAINKASGSTGVTAFSLGNGLVSTNTATGGAGDGGTMAAGTIKINGVDIGAIDLSGDADSDIQNLVTAINAKTSETGVTANTDTTDGGASGEYLILANATGESISINVTTAAAATLTGFSQGETTVAAGDNGAIVLSTELNGNITAGDDATAQAMGYASAAALTSAKSDDALATVSVSTVSASNATILAVDAALATIDSERGKLGAIQNRLESTIANLMNVSENVSASRSRILDADFAAETANLTKAQILQQAGTAMLAQANTVPQAALTLLQG